jgi:hypothetical protein
MSERKLKPVARLRPDGRKSLLVYVDPEVIKRLKKAALDLDMNAYEIAELALKSWLSDKKGRAHV